MLFQFVNRVCASIAACIVFLAIPHNVRTMQLSPRIVLICILIACLRIYFSTTRLSIRINISRISLKNCQTIQKV